MKFGYDRLIGYFLVIGESCNWYVIKKFDGHLAISGCYKKCDVNSDIKEVFDKYVSDPFFELDVERFCSERGYKIRKWLI